jgi:hypothetical protein
MAELLLLIKFGVAILEGAIIEAISKSPLSPDLTTISTLKRDKVQSTRMNLETMVQIHYFGSSIIFPTQLPVRHSRRAHVGPGWISVLI